MGTALDFIGSLTYDQCCKLQDIIYNNDFDELQCYLYNRCSGAPLGPQVSGTGVEIDWELLKNIPFQENVFHNHCNIWGT